MAAIEVVDIAYQPSPAMLARLYRPSGIGPFPAIVEVHGGGWGSGDRLNDASLNETLARAGIIVAALDFRLAGEAMYPASVADVNLGIRWLKSIARDIGSRPDLVGGLGTSSGGHQLLLNALRPHDPLYTSLAPTLYADVDASLRFVIACWPVADPLARYRMAEQADKQALLRSHHAYWRSEQEMDEGNPQRILERGQQSHLPPALVIQGTADENLTPDMAERFALAYRKAGGDAQLELFDGEPHAFVTRKADSAATARAIKAIEAFIMEQSGAD